MTIDQMWGLVILGLLLTVGLFLFLLWMFRRAVKEVEYWKTECYGWRERYYATQKRQTL